MSTIYYAVREDSPFGGWSYTAFCISRAEAEKYRRDFSNMTSGTSITYRIVPIKVLGRYRMGE